MSQKWFYIFFFSCVTVFSQEKPTNNFTLDAQYYYGTLLRHNKNIAHLVREHPIGFLVSYNHKTYGEKYWQQSYNYPDWGVSFLYQNFNYDVLGEDYGLYGHYNFYFLKRHLMLRLGQGIAYNTKPFDIETNCKNIAYGSHLLASTYILLQFNKDHLIDRIGLNAGISFVHHSNGSFKAPNSGTNALGFNIGLKYDFTEGEEIYQKEEDPKDFSEKIKFNFLFRSGVNESDYFNLGQHPFYVFTAYADKRLNYQSTLQFGVEYFISPFLEKEIEYIAASFNNKVSPDTDYKRAAVMLGHEFRIGKMAIPTQLGYYFYWPYEYESRVYSRVGVQYYLTEKLFGVATVKTHAANAECIEFGIGVRI